MKKYGKETIKRITLFLVVALVATLLEPAGVRVRAENATGALAGDAETGYYINMPASGTTELVVPEGVDMFKVYDNGGKDIAYGNGCDGYLLLTAPEGYVINVSGTVTTEGISYDWLTVFDGNNTGCSHLGESTKYGSPTGTTISLVSSSGNQILLYFRADGSSQYAGVDLTVSLQEKKEKYLVTASQQSEGTLTLYAGEEIATSVSENALVTVVATPSEGYDLVGLEATDKWGNAAKVTDGFWYTNNTGTFVMPAADMTVKGIYENTSGEEEIEQTMPVTGVKELKIARDVKKFKVYTDAGNVGRYSVNCDGYLLLTAPEGYIISLHGSVKTEVIAADYLSLYDGNSTAAGQMGALAKYGSATQEQVEFLTSTTNQVLLYFHSDGSNHAEGVNLTVTLGAVDEEYGIDVEEHENGTVKILTGGEETETAQGGETVTVVGTPKEGYDLTGIEVTDDYGRALVVEEGFWYTNNTGAFVMPAVGVTVKCIFTDTSTGENVISQTIPATGTKELKIARNVKEFKVYSSGGRDSEYGNYENGFLLLTAPEDFIMKLSGTCVTESVSCDWLTIYDGNVQSDSAIVGSAKYGSPDNETVETIVSSGNQMLLYFRTDSGGTRSGVNLTVKLSDLNKKYALKAETTPYGKLVFKVDEKQVSEAAELKTVTAIATPTEGYMLTGMSALDGEGNQIEIGGGTWHDGNAGTFLMPESTVTIYPEFTKIEEMTDEMYQNLPSSGSVSIGIPREIRSFKIYDNGGKTGNYADYSNVCAYLTAPEGYLIQLTGTLNSESGRDCLNIYDGHQTTDKLLGGAYSGTGVDIGTLTSSGTKVLLTFATDQSSTQTGFDLTATLVPITYEIVYDLSGGLLEEGVTNPETYTADDVVVVNNPLLDGYVFDGWTGTGLSEATVDVTLPIGSYGDRAYTAVWRKLLTHEDVTVQVEEQTYTGMFEDPITIKDGETVLVRDEDYSVTYKKGNEETEYPTDAGTYEVTITGLGTYAGMVKKEFVCKHIQLTLAALTAISRAYDRTDQVVFSEAILSGIAGSDMVQPDYEKLRGTISSASCGEYVEVVLTEFPLKGEHAHNYTVILPEGPFALTEPVTISKAQNALGMPSAVMKVDYLTKTVGDVKLPEDWAWQTADKAKQLVVSAAVTATATYEGADKDNYENTSVVVAITRQPCAHAWDAGTVTAAPTAIAKGKKTYTCSICKGTKTEDIPANGLPKKGAVAVDAKTGMQYKVTKAAVSGGTVEVTKQKNKKVTTVTIPDAVMIDGVTYKVTSIAKNAFSGCTKLKKVTIGKNVTKIGAKAFYKCKKLKNVIIKTTKLKAKTIGKQAFKGTPKKMTLKVPKKKMKLYKKILKAKGVNKKAKYKKL